SSKRVPVNVTGDAAGFGLVCLDQPITHEVVGPRAGWESAILCDEEENGAGVVGLPLDADGAVPVVRVDGGARDELGRVIHEFVQGINLLPGEGHRLRHKFVANVCLFRLFLKNSVHYRMSSTMKESAVKE